MAAPANKATHTCTAQLLLLLLLLPINSHFSSFTCSGTLVEWGFYRLDNFHISGSLAQKHCTLSTNPNQWPGIIISSSIAKFLTEGTLVTLCRQIHPACCIWYLNIDNWTTHVAPAWCTTESSEDSSKHCWRVTVQKPHVNHEALFFPHSRLDVPALHHILWYAFQHYIIL